MSRAEAARQAYAMSLAQLERLRTGDLDAYLTAEAELAGVYRDLADPAQPPGEGYFEDEFEATTRELVGVQQVICAELDALLQRTAEAISAQRRRRALSGAYAVRDLPQHPRGA